MAKRPTVTTPKGRLKYPRILGKPDTKFNADGVWQTQFILNTQDAGVNELLERIKAEHAKAIESETATQKEKNAGKKVTVKEGDLPFTESEDGDTVELRFKLKFKGENKKKGETWENRVAVFDAKGKPLPNETKIGSGTLAKIAFEFTPFYVAASKTAGVSLRLKAVQCIEIVEFGGDASQFGFGDEDEDSPVSTVAKSGDDDEENEETTAQSGADF